MAKQSLKGVRKTKATVKKTKKSVKGMPKGKAAVKKTKKSVKRVPKLTITVRNRHGRKIWAAVSAGADGG